MCVAQTDRLEQRAQFVGRNDRRHRNLDRLVADLAQARQCLDVIGGRFHEVANGISLGSKNGGHQ
jgi:hypothetical protein